MTSPQFTPGPWRILPSDRMGPTPRIEAEDGHRIAVLEWNLRNAPDKQGTANANLIAAAPELYEALRALADCDIPEPDTPLPDSDIARYAFSMGEIRAARAVIAKADGRA